VSVPTVAEARAVAAQVPDPELPVLTLADLGVLRDVRVRPDGTVEVDVTPTYSGCPAVAAIQADVLARLAERGWPASVRVVLAPAWTTDEISADGRRKLLAYGIAPPGHAHRAGGPVPVALAVRCPQCGSADTHELSRFGSTACKALWVCRSCAEPFDHFKAL
jgi:ring-1,2-phenylacetyl-CoA epoxidase subunit PaaD